MFDSLSRTSQIIGTAIKCTRTLFGTSSLGTRQKGGVAGTMTSFNMATSTGSRDAAHKHTCTLSSK